MKNSISHILSFCLMLIILISIFFTLFQIELRTSIIKKNLNKNDYYYDVYDNFLVKLEDYIINEEVLNIYKEYLNIGIIKKDVNKIVKNITVNKNNEISRYNDFYNVMLSYCDDDIISKKYALELDKIYINNLFPTKEFKLIYKLHTTSNNLLLFDMTTALIILIISVILFIINRNFKFHIISLISSTIILILPNIFLKLFNIFENFIYTNNHYTKILISVIENFISNAFYIGLIVMLMSIFTHLRKSKKQVK